MSGYFLVLLPSYCPPSGILSSLPHLSSPPAPHLLSCSGALSTWTAPTPATRKPPLLVSAPRIACLRLLPFPRPPPPPPFPPFAWYQVPIGTLGVALHGSPHSSVNLSLPTFVCPYFRNLLVLGLSFGVSIFARGRGARAPPLPGSRSTWPAPPLLLVHVGAVQDTWLPNPPTRHPLSLNPYHIYPIPRSKFVGRSARSISVQILQSSKRLIILQNRGPTVYSY